uniref:Uncharacterized protein n=1 Tax=Arundo donax TaxID=35708 RepID=A0A0A9CL28_ARUDO
MTSWVMTLISSFCGCCRGASCESTATILFASFELMPFFLKAHPSELWPDPV